MARQSQLLALTVIQPFAHFLALGVKKVENRDWRPPNFLVGKWIAIHAGKTYDEASAEGIRNELGLDVPDEASIPLGAIVAVAVIDRIASTDHEAGYDEWYTGPYGWFLRDVVKIEPVPCRGYRKLWPVPKAEHALVREAYRRATSGPATHATTTAAEKI